ncbi:DNA internalization-related competence protein ComEC/Rec2 [Salisaeta longa]|uniref:DNA internalization-related competence protein ComEC/Rec2 n=1 Tax=Salisaeta longa TaxID=503170 RepID=UPI0003B63A38|nr:DNA internalization-related competence protein ComEC/Rec2 [Salisaeta longa]
MPVSATPRWMAYPALWLAGALAASVAASNVSFTVSVWHWGALALVGGAVAGAAQWIDRQRLVSLAPLLRFCVALLLFFTMGGARMAIYQRPAPHALRSYVPDRGPERSIQLRGVVDAPPSRSSRAFRFTMRATAWQGPLDTLAVTGRVQVTRWVDDRAAHPDVRDGTCVVVTGRLQRPPTRRNPGAFDYRAYLARRGVYWTMTLERASLLQTCGTAATWLDAAAYAARAHVRGAIDAFGQRPTTQSVLRALLLGDRSGLSAQREAQFAATGLMHLLAVSGLHVLLVGMVIFLLLKPLLVRASMPWVTMQWVRAVSTIVLLGTYLLLTGMQASVVRAVVMAIIFIGGAIIQRSSTALNSLGLAMIVLLVLRPPMLFDVGFQLSVAAVAGIVVLNPVLVDALPTRWTEGWWGPHIVTVVTTSVAATLATAPVLAVHFGRVAFAGLLLNVLAIPLTALVLLSGLLVVCCAPVPLAAGAFGSTADASVQGLLWIVARGATWLRWTLWETPAWSWVHILAFGAGLGALAQWRRPRWRWGLAVASIGILACGALASAVRVGDNPRMDAVMLDVGQGDAMLFSFPNEQHVLVDAGPKTRFTNAGAAVVVPFLKRQGITSLDALVITHPDADHLGGALSVLRSVGVQRVVRTEWASRNRLIASFERLVDSLKVPVRYVEAGDTLDISSAMVEVLGPPPRRHTYAMSGDNERSVVLRIAYGTTQWVLLGDVEHRGEGWLVYRYGDALNADVVKVAHHGSSTSSRLPLVRAISDDSSQVRALISAGVDNRFDFPAPTVVNRWEEHGAVIRSTKHSGAIWLRSDGRKIWRRRWR